MKSIFNKRSEPSPQQAAAEQQQGPFFTKPAPNHNIQAKMKVGENGDAYEQEANNVAQGLFGGSVSAPSEVVQSKAQTAPHAPSPLEQQVEQAKGNGAPLPDAVKSQMEPAFQRDFSSVKIHTGPQAEQLTQQANAHAFTHNNHIFYNKGQEPGVNPLTAHELTHVAQQGAPKAATSAAPQQHNMGTKSKVTGHGGSKGVTHSESPGTMRACAKAPDAFAPALGRKKDTLKGTAGDFEVEHGLDKAPAGAVPGEYYYKVEMTPNATTVGSKIAFMQSVRRGTDSSHWSVNKDDSGMTEDRAKRATPDGTRVDRADPAADKTPFYGMYKDSGGAVKQYSTSQVGESGGAKAMMQDAPAVLDPSILQFSSTAMDMSTGKNFGTVAWGFTYNSSSRTYNEETPSLIDATSDRSKSRDASFKKWNDAVATPGSGVDKVPGI